MRKMLWMAVAALLAVPPLARAQERVDFSCRREIVRMCGIDRAKIAACLKPKMDQLTPGCKAQVETRVAQMILDGARKAGNGGQTPLAAGATELRYGSDAAQAVDFYPAPRAGRSPLVLFIHGGGWAVGNKRHLGAEKAGFYNGLGYAFASVNYRLVPQADPAGQARDIAAALAFLRKDAAGLGFDPDRIVLIGHSAGAHLAALLSSDTRYLAEAGITPTSIRGAILLDGAGYDVSEQMRSRDTLLQKLYTDAFTTDPAKQKMLSPVSYVAAPNVANWLLIHVAARADSGAQARELALGLSKNGASAKVVAVPDSTHMTVNKDAGVAGTFVGERIAAFLKAVL